jgi:hypothetical protein
VHAINAVFESSNVQMALSKIDLIPSQIDGLSHSQTVASHVCVDALEKVPQMAMCRICIRRTDPSMYSRFVPARRFG